MATKVVKLIYWRDTWSTGLVFTGLVVGLACLFQLSAVTLVSHVCLAVLCVTFPLRLYYKLLDLLRFNHGTRPFESYLAEDSSLTDEETVMLVEKVVLLIAFGLTEMKRLLFIDSMFNSFKFLVLMYLLTYVGVLTNGLTLVIVGVICLFSLPLFYSRQKGRINRLVRRIVKVTKAFLGRIKSMYQMLYNLARPSSVTVPAPAKTKLKAK